MGPRRPGPELAGLEGERCTLHVADVLDVLAGRAGHAGPWDVVLLDVDNGPDFLVHASNAPLYAPPALAAARSDWPPAACSSCGPRTWRPPSWRPCARSPTDDDEVAEDVVEVEREGRALRYALYSLARAPAVLTG